MSYVDTAKAKIEENPTETVVITLGIILIAGLFCSNRRKKKAEVEAARRKANREWWINILTRRPKHRYALEFVS